MKPESDTAWIYALIDPRDEEIRYVGWTNNLKKRYGCHLRDKKPCYRTYWIMKLRRMGLKPRMEIIQRVSLQSWAEAEIYWISYFRKIGCKLVNGTDGGQGHLGWCPSEETRAKMSVAQKGKHHNSPKHLLKLLKAAKRPKSAEHRAKIGNAHKGKKHTPEHTAHWRESMRKHRENKEIQCQPST